MLISLIAQMVKITDHVRQIGVLKQQNGGHVGVPNHSSEN